MSEYIMSGAEVIREHRGLNLTDTNGNDIKPTHLYRLTGLKDGTAIFTECHLSRDAHKTVVGDDQYEPFTNIKNATYDNSFCMDSSCKHYFEDMCMLSMCEEGVSIWPDDDVYFTRKSEACPQFEEGISDWYKELETSDSCDKCGSGLHYSEKHDAYYCLKCHKWAKVHV